MAYKRYNYDYEFDDTKSATFNQAVLQMNRLNKLIDRIHDCSINILEYNQLLLDYNYKIIFISLNSLREEIWSKLTKEEREDIVKLKNSIEFLLENYPIHRPLRNRKFPYDVKTNIDSTSSKIVLKLLDEYKLKIMDLMDEHGFGNPDQDIPQGL